MTAKQSKQLWDRLIDLHFKKIYKPIGDKLKHVRFIKDGEFRVNESSKYARKHFPGLIKKFEDQRRDHDFNNIKRNEQLSIFP